MGGAVKVLFIRALESPNSIFFPFPLEKHMSREGQIEPKKRASSSHSSLEPSLSPFSIAGTSRPIFVEYPHILNFRIPCRYRNRLARGCFGKSHGKRIFLTSRWAVFTLSPHPVTYGNLWNFVCNRLVPDLDWISGCRFAIDTPQV